MTKLDGWTFTPRPDCTVNDIVVVRNNSPTTIYVVKEIISSGPDGTTVKICSLSDEKSFLAFQHQLRLATPYEIAEYKLANKKAV